MKKGDIIENNAGVKAYYRGSTNKTGYKVYIDGKLVTIPFNELNLWHYANPIVDNRIVEDTTFAVRFNQFLEWIPKDWWMSQPHYYEEFEYMSIVAERLLKYQITTIENEDEIKYFKNLGIDVGEQE